jgi:hypothetical protein
LHACRSTLEDPPRLREAELALRKAEAERPDEDLSRLRAELEAALVRVKTAERYLSR